jgi:hypothetical protein
MGCLADFGGKILSGEVGEKKKAYITIAPAKSTVICGYYGARAFTGQQIDHYYTCPQKKK